MRVAALQITLGIIAVILGVLSLWYFLAERSQSSVTVTAGTPDYTVSVSGETTLPTGQAITITFPTNTRPIFSPDSQDASAPLYVAVGVSLALGLTMLSVGVFQLRTARQQDAI